jgi:hypothetical protein
MKNVKSLGKLSLKKETVARLNDLQMHQVQGGSLIGYTTKCYVISDFKPIPPCTISFTDGVIKDKVIIH